MTTLCPRIPSILACSHAPWALSCSVGSTVTSDIGRARRVDGFGLRAPLGGSCSARISAVFDLSFEGPEGASGEVRRLASRSRSLSISLSRLDLLFTSFSGPRTFSWIGGAEGLTGAAGAVGDLWRNLFDSLALSRASLASPLPVRLCEGDMFEPWLSCRGKSSGRGAM